MKKSIFAICFILFSFILFAEEKFISFSAGFSSGIPFYTSEELLQSQTDLADGNRVILGSLFELKINPLKEVTFFTGADILCDFLNQAPFASNHLGFDIPFGVKLYPGIEGLCFGIAYAIGYRYDFYNTEELGKTNKETSWGNGFKFLLEYNFAHCAKSSFLPSIGCYWKHMPRGENTYDDHICAYISANF